jgi:hypothetical protein
VSAIGLLVGNIAECEKFIWQRNEEKHFNHEGREEHEEGKSVLKVRKSSYLKATKLPFLGFYVAFSIDLD